MNAIPPGSQSRSHGPTDPEHSGLQDDIDEIIRRVTAGGGGSGLAAAEIVRYLYINATAVTRPHTHRWDILGVKPESQPAIHPRMNFRPFTVVLVRCLDCGWPETTELDGLWTEAQITARINEKGERTNERA